MLNFLVSKDILISNQPVSGSVGSERSCPRSNPNSLPLHLPLLVSKLPPLPHPAVRTGRWEVSRNQTKPPYLLCPAFSLTWWWRELQEPAWGCEEKNRRSVAPGFWKTAAATCLLGFLNRDSNSYSCNLQLGECCYFLQQVLLSACHIPGTILGSRNTKWAEWKRLLLRSFLPHRGKADTGNTKHLFISNSNSKGSLVRHRQRCYETAILKQPCGLGSKQPVPTPNSVSSVQEFQVFDTMYGNTFGSPCHQVFLVYFKYYLKEKHGVAKRKILWKVFTKFAFVCLNFPREPS